jgi:hypothetical protein
MRPIKWIKDETGKIVGYEKFTQEEIIADKEAKLLAMYEELKALKGE